MRTRPKINIDKTLFFLIAITFGMVVIVGRLFHLQIIKHNHFEALAQSYQHGELEISAQRGEIIIKDHHSAEEFPLATNTTLNLLFADPALIKDPFYIVEHISPLVFDLEEARAKDEERLEELRKTIVAEATPEELATLLRPLSDEELQQNFEKDLEEKLKNKIRSQILLAENLDAATIKEISAKNLSGLEIVKQNLYAYPSQISSRNVTAEILAPLIDIPAKRLTQILKGENRYVVIKRKLHPDISDQITALIKEDKKLKEEDRLLAGLSMQEEYFRYYPEQELAANVVGYTDNTGSGQYGIESTFEYLLQGTKGSLQSKRDSIGKLITVGGSELKAAVDGADIVLTIDRSIQMKSDQILANAVRNYRADSGQIIVMEPKTGRVLAMSHYPSFNPNSFGEVFKKVEISLTEEEKESSLIATKTKGLYEFLVNPFTREKYPVFEETDENGLKHYYRYENFQGPEVYHNKIVSWPYEPGSVFKTIAMAIGIDDGDITANTTYNDIGPIGVDFNVYTQKHDFEIKNALNRYLGLIDMTTVLAESLNTGMTFIAKKIGPALFYNYLDKFGFLEKTNIEFDTEKKGQVAFFENWTESELATKAFGQGLTINMVQMVNGYNTIANGGILMQPYIIDEIRYDDGKTLTTEPKELRRVISEESANTVTQMLVTAIEEGVAANAKTATNYIAGKTGTSQTYRNGRALSGAGTTIASIAGFAPIDDPKFTILIKLDYPKTSEWADSTASHAFRELSQFLFEYYNIPPDKK
ncbi:penicillin-binding protein 2 [Candidatus Gracilibacteria bacterium]|nr:penicillin-binding protein 2 [Candidatus Gracilibacteria bacterium]